MATPGPEQHAAAAAAMAAAAASGGSAQGCTTTTPGLSDMPKVSDLAALQSLQSMDWIFKKERIFLLAQFWQQRATLAEKEVHTLKEQLQSATSIKKENNNNNNTSNNNDSVNSTNNNNNNNNNNNINTENVVESSEPSDRKTPIEERLQSKEKEVSKEGLDMPPSRYDQFSVCARPSLSLPTDDVSKLVEDISRLQAALSGVKEVTAAQMHALEEQLELKNRLIHRLELKLEQQKEIAGDKERDFGMREARPISESVSLPPRTLESILMDRPKAEHELKVPTSEFACLVAVEREGRKDVHGFCDERVFIPGGSATQLGPPPFHHPLRPHLPHPLAPPPMASPLQPLAPHPPHATPFHHLLGDDWRRSFERSALDRQTLSSGQISPDSGAPERSDSRDSPMGDVNMKSPSSLANGFDNKSPFQPRDDRSPFKDEMTPLSFKFEDRITGESLIPKGDPMEARLQEILRFNMEKYSQQNLDTLHISRRVRELLSIHNIGQRLFAKYILGLSQGTVSELLSKPKPWDKLTEKGRDSYRKMHAWATDENAVFLLKSLIPKKGNRKPTESESRIWMASLDRVEGGPGKGRDTEYSHFTPPQGAHKDGPGGLRGPEEVVTEERIQHILTEASRAMSNASVSVASNQPTSQEDSRSTDSKSPASSTHSPSPISRDGRPRPRKPDYDDIPQEKVARIYQEELAKLMTPRPEPPMPLHREQYPGILFPFLSQSLLFNRPPEEVKMAIDAYHQEISKLQGAAATGMGLGAAGLGIGCPGGMGVGPMGGNTGSGLSGVGLGAGGLHNGGAQDLTLPKREPRMNGLSTASVVASSSSPLASLVTPLTSIATSSPDDSQVNASPLQRMARITNSLITAPPLSSSSALVTQKPLKAVLPPITQQQFDMYSNMNTEEIVKQVKEQLSQYSISQRLFGESVLGLSQGSVSDLLARPKPWHMLTQKGREPFIRMKMFLEDDNAVHKLVASQYKIAPEKLMRTGGYAAPPPSTSKPHIKLPADLPKTSMESPLPPVGIPSSLGGLPLPSHPPPFDTRLPLLDPLRKVWVNAGMGPRHPGPVAPSVYEMAALTQDLDTQVITTKIKEALLANNIGQKLFGEAVLGLSQGSVSELLSKPKPWHMLSIKGREPFIRMQMWINDPHNVEKLQQLKNERREASKRRRALDPTVEASTSDSQDMFQVPSPGGSTKKARVLFSEEQKEALRLAFALDPYPNMATIEFLSQELQLSTRTITNWFHNHRMRLKQQSGPPGSCGSSGEQGPLTQVPSPSRESQQPFDPLHFRLLLSQRLMELRKEKGLPPTLPGLTAAPGLGGLHAGLFPHFPPLAAQGFTHGLDRDNPTGLDLSMKNDNDYDSNASLMDEDSNMSGGMSPSASQRSEGEEGGGDREGVHGAPSPAARSSSRRKPAAPQWVNPSWAASGDSKEREVIINGVCVMQTDDYRHREEETVRIEPTAVDENRAGRSSTGEEEQENLPTTEEDLPPQLGGSGSRRSSPQPMEQDDQLQEASEEATAPSTESQEASSSQQPLTEREGTASGAGCDAEDVVEDEEA